MSVPEQAPPRTTFSIGILISVLWLLAFAIYVQTKIGWSTLGELPPAEMGGLVAGFTAPLALLWLILSIFRRGSGSMQSNAGALEDEVRRLSLPLSETEAKTMRIADAMRRQVETLNAASANAQGRLQATADALDVQSKRIAQVAEQLVDEVDRAKQRLAGEAKTLEERIGAVALGLRREVGQLEVAIAEAGQRLEAQAAGFGNHVEAARKAFAKPSAELAEMADRLAEQPAAFARATREHAEILLGAAAKAVDEMEMRIKARAVAMDGLFENLVAGGEKVQDQMRSQLAELARAAAETGEAGQALTRQSAEIGDSIKATLEQGLASLRGVVAQTGEAANEVGLGLERRSAELVRSIEDHSHSLSQALTAHNESLGGQLQQQSQDLMRETTARGAEVLRELRRETEQVVEGFGAIDRTSQALRESLKAQSTEGGIVADRIAGEAQAIVASFRAETGALADAMKGASGEAAELAAALRRQVDAIVHATGEATGSVTMLQTDIGQRLAQLSAETDAVATRALGVAETYRQHSLELTQATGREHERIAELGKSLQEGAMALSLTAAEALERQQAIITALRMQREALTQAAGEGDQRVGHLRQTVRELAAELAIAAAEASRQAEDATHAFKGETEALVTAARQATEQVATVRTSVGEQLSELGRLATESGNLARSARDDLLPPIAELAGAADRLDGRATDARVSVAALRDETKLLAERLDAAAKDTGHQLSAIGDQIEARSKTLMSAADYVRDHAGGVGGGLAEQAEKLNTVVTGAMARILELAQVLERQKQSLAAAGALAQKQVDALDAARERVRRESFLQSAAEVVTELNSLSLDLARLMDSDVPGDVWRRYKKGDRSAFARWLLRSKGSYTVQGMEARYLSDDRFRDLVSRFIAKFEALLAESGRADPEDVLNTAFLTADIGKLYLLLQRNIGRSTEH